MRLAATGREKVALQLLMMYESSFSRNAQKADTQGVEVKYAMPFLSTPENRIGILKALEPDFGDGVETATVLVGHGVLKDFKYNDGFIKMDEYLRENYRNVFLGTLHGPPSWNRLVADVKRSGCRKVHFISLLMTTSEHISVDIMGNGPEINNGP